MKSRSKSQTNPFFVSVIMPVFNGEAFLDEAVQSILQQAYEPLEIIIVDDGSEDRTRTIALQFGTFVRYLYQENRGAPAARNRGLSMARGDIIGFLDADDLWVPRRLQSQLPRFIQDPSLEIVWGRLQRFRASGAEGKCKYEYLDEAWLAPSLGSALFRKSVFDKIGHFDKDTLACDDLDWFMRAHEKDVKMFVSEEVSVFYRRHDKNMTNDENFGNHFLLKSVKKSIDRRRREKR